MIELKINGKMTQLDVSEDMPLLWALRDVAKLTGSKYGCGKGICGACTVHIDGQAMRSCITPMSYAKDKTITTIEGLSEKGDHPVQQAWLDLNVAQCGYCQTGQIMTASALLAQNNNPSDEDINNAMAGNICRCGTYPRIRAAIKMAAKTQGTGESS
ncbi:MAG: (2Fe-2S)-binding protein [Marinicella sp.]